MKESTQQLVSTTIYTIDRLKKEFGKDAGDCLLLYFELIKHSAIQETGSVYANNNFLQNGLGWGKEKLSKTKKQLMSVGLLEEILRSDGRLIQRFLKTNFIIRTKEEQENQYKVGETRPTEKPSDGKTATNALVLKEEKCFCTKTESVCRARAKENRHSFAPPTQEEVVAFFLENGYTEEYAIEKYKYYAENNWHDSKGNPVLNWKQKYRGVWMKGAEGKKKVYASEEEELADEYMRLGGYYPFREKYREMNRNDFDKILRIEAIVRKHPGWENI